ncbi:MAG: glycosyltransferase [Pleurocapsa sp.]
MKSLRIALFTYSTKPRGGVIHTLELAEAIQGQGHEVCVYALDKDNLGFHRSLNCASKLVPTKPAASSIDKLIAQRIEEFNGLEVELKQRLGITNHPVYLSIGGIEPRKNSLKLLQAFSQVLKTQPQAQLIIAGGDTLFDYKPYRVAFFNLVQQSEIAIGKSLILPGVISDRDLPVLYRCADAFVFPSVKEGWGLVLLEAIASGLPIITSFMPPFTEFLDHETALLVDPHSIDAIAACYAQDTQPKS